MEGFYRKEIKYPLSQLDFLRLRKTLEYYMEYDVFSGISGYKVRSLYFDSLDDRDLYDKLDGTMEKRKIRLRIYSHDSPFVNLEYKCKSGSDGIKRKLKITRAEALKMIDCDYDFLLQYEDPLARTIHTRLLTGGYLPKTIVEYRRIAYKYPVSDTRITFDAGTSASYFPQTFFDSRPNLIPLIPGDQGVLEVKYDHFLVGTIKQVLRLIDSSPNANSKYSQSRVYY